MRVLVVPDVHLKTFIFDRASELMHDGIADAVVVLMDIADDWGKERDVDAYCKAYDRAIDFAKSFPGNSFWCYGNHDLSYVWDKEETGFSPIAKNTVIQKLNELENTLSGNNSIKYIHMIDNVVFSHAGVSSYFVERKVPISKYNDIGYVINTINAFGCSDMWCYDSPIWYRPQRSTVKNNLYKPRKLLQVVGHTPVESLMKQGNLISCDVFSTNKDGTPIGTQEFLVVDTESWEIYGIK